MGSVIQVISGKIEEVELPEKVDVIISEPMGYMLLNERMLETYLHAKKWLKPGGRMFPTRGDLHVAPFSDEALYMEQINKVNFWYQDYFHGVNLSSLRNAALGEYFRQPIVSIATPQFIVLLALFPMFPPLNIDSFIFKGRHFRHPHLPGQDSAPRHRLPEG